MARDKDPKTTLILGGLPFEKPIEDVRGRLAELERLASRTSHDLSEEIQECRQRLDRLTHEVYSRLTPWNRVQVARHPDRPLTSDYVAGFCTDFVELSGDGCYGDDKAILTGLATIGAHKVMLVGHRKGRTTKERLAYNFGSAHPEGYRKALRKMRLAERLRMPIVCLVDTQGAYPGVGAEERGQARAIAENIFEMFDIRVPIVVIVLGEGGSGGALGIAVGDRVGMLENGWYSVISPEGCASILWHSAEGREQAAQALKLTAADLRQLGIVDAVIPEPLGGAHRDPGAAIDSVRAQIQAWLDELAALPPERLVEERYRKFRHICQLAAVGSADGAGNGSAGSLPAALPSVGPVPDPARAGSRK
ncbi:MAG: acetyl-CoA carboxylase carboxyltransferase subunit alpha [Planctomycetota bacterium]|nr:MAG: acetyl-CoA carboxylase carboxyltransferase subunit alpha [Planctomycetota bacterium]